jgi:hypothetical protein
VGVGDGQSEGAQSIELTKNPAAMISALRKIEGAARCKAGKARTE